MRPERADSPTARASIAPSPHALASHAHASHALASHALDPSRVLVIGCGALARELVAVIDQAGLANVDLTCLPATLHNRPGGIPAAVRERIRAARPRYERIFIAYADCGTGGRLDAILADEGVERLPGAHCYELYSGPAAFAAMADEEPGTFYLTDFLARNFDRLVIAGLGLDRHPELLPTYFGNYRRLVYLAQTEDRALVAAARRAARRLGLAFALRATGYGDLATSLVTAARPADSLAPGASSHAHASMAAAESFDSLPPEQEIRRSGHPRIHDLRRAQETGRRRPRGRRWLRPVQGPAGILPGTQGTEATDATPRRTA